MLEALSRATRTTVAGAVAGVGAPTVTTGATGGAEVSELGAGAPDPKFGVGATATGAGVTGTGATVTAAGAVGGTEAFGATTGTGCA